MKYFKIRPNARMIHLSVFVILSILFTVNSTRRLQFTISAENEEILTPTTPEWFINIQNLLEKPVSQTQRGLEHIKSVLTSKGTKLTPENWNFIKDGISKGDARSVIKVIIESTPGLNNDTPTNLEKLVNNSSDNKSPLDLFKELINFLSTESAKTSEGINKIRQMLDSMKNYIPDNKWSEVKEMIQSGKVSQDKTTKERVIHILRDYLPLKSETGPSVSLKIKNKKCGAKFYSKLRELLNAKNAKTKEGLKMIKFYLDSYFKISDDSWKAISNSIMDGTLQNVDNIKENKKTNTPQITRVWTAPKKEVDKLANQLKANKDDQFKGVPNKLVAKSNKGDEFKGVPDKLVAKSKSDKEKEFDRPTLKASKPYLWVKKEVPSTALTETKKLIAIKHDQLTAPDRLVAISQTDRNLQGPDRLISVDKVAKQTSDIALFENIPDRLVSKSKYEKSDSSKENTSTDKPYKWVKKELSIATSAHYENIPDRIVSIQKDYNKEATDPFKDIPDRLVSQQTKQEQEELTASDRLVAKSTKKDYIWIKKAQPVNEDEPGNKKYIWVRKDKNSSEKSDTTDSDCNSELNFTIATRDRLIANLRKN